MTRKLKAGGLAFFAILLMGSVMASAAQATEFTSSSYPVEIWGVDESHHVFKIDGNEVTCNEVNVHAVATGPSTTQTMTPTYDLCTAFGLNAVIDMNGCDYLVHLPAGTATHVQATVDLVCPAGKDVTITAGAGTCVAHIPPFTGKGHITIKNSHPHITELITLSGITATLTDVSPFFCPLTGNTHTTTATYEGSLTVIDANVGTISISG